MKSLPVLSFLILVQLGSTAWAGEIFLTGHDPDFHASQGSNAPGAQHIEQAAISFITDPTHNPYAGDHKFLFVESSITPPPGYTDGQQGIIDAGYTAGVGFEKHDASDLATELGKLGTKYDAIVVGSDFGGILTQAELDILDGHSAQIISFLNSGGGLFAMAEGNNGGTGLTPNGGWFGYLPFVTTAADDNQGESGFTVTPYGALLGLAATDVNGNASHNIFTGTFGLNVVDTDASGHILSLAGEGQVTSMGVPEPASLLLLGVGLAALGSMRRRRRG